jgi:hypothetical protein
MEISFQHLRIKFTKNNKKYVIDNHLHDDFYCFVYNMFRPNQTVFMRRELGVNGLRHRCVYTCISNK